MIHSTTADVAPPSPMRPQGPSVTARTLSADTHERLKSCCSKAIRQTHQQERLRLHRNSARRSVLVISQPAARPVSATRTSILPSSPLSSSPPSSISALKETEERQSRTEPVCSAPASCATHVFASSHQQQQQMIVLQGKKRFNADPKRGLQFLAAQGYFQRDPPTPEDIARFLLLDGDLLSKRAIGAYLGDPRNRLVLSAFVRLQEFHGKRLDLALRQFLRTFHLPGEAQQIDRLMESFAQHYVHVNPQLPVFRQHPDRAYILAFSLILLNTDLHNPAIKRKITKDFFLRNNKDILLRQQKVKIDPGIDGSALTESAPCLQQPTETLASQDAAKSEFCPEEDEGQQIQSLLEELFDAIQMWPLEVNSGSSTDDDPLATDYTFLHPEREGWLWKQGGRIKTWKRRYCILTGSCLYYFKGVSSRTYSASSSSTPTPLDSRSRTLSLPRSNSTGASVTAPFSEKPQSARSKQPCGIIPLENLQVSRWWKKGSARAAGKGERRHYFQLSIQSSSTALAGEDDASSEVTTVTDVSVDNLSISKRKSKPPVIKAAKTDNQGRIIEGTKVENDIYLITILLSFCIVRPTYGVFICMRKRTRV